MKCITVIGARPQFIKAATISRLMQKNSMLNEKIIHTGQHYDENMSDVFFSELDIPVPDYNLNVGSMSHGAQTGRMVEGIEKILFKESPDCVLVYGDTNSTLSAALVAVKQHIKVVHVEAGLRSFNKRMPEEINRIVTDHCSDILFVPSENSKNNLIHEGINRDNIFVSGDVMYDAAQYYLKKIDDVQVKKTLGGLQKGNYILATIHRAESTEEFSILEGIFQALQEVAKRIEVVIPLHPRTLHILKENGRYNDLTNGLNVLPPKSYLEMLILEKYSMLIATDSGGVQKEAFFNKIPCVTLRTETEWIELVEMEWNIVVPPVNKDIIVDQILSRTNKKGKDVELYGNGKAAEFIVNKLLELN